MFYGTGAEPGEHDFDPNAVEPPWGPRRRSIGNIHTIVGSFTVARAGAAVVQLAVGDPVFEGDIVETGADSSVSIHFSDGAVFELSACARMVLSEFAGDGASSSSALFVLSKGAIAFMAGRAAKGGLWIDTPIARIRGSRGGGIVSLAMAALAFAALKEVRADDQPVIDDERVELPHGTFELVTKELVPQVIVVDDPWKTVVLQKVGSTVDVDRVANSFERMDDLGQISRDTFAIFRQGQQDPYINHQQRAAVGTGETRADLSISDFSDVPVVTPANLISPDSDPEFDVVPTNFAPAPSYIPEVPIVIPTTIVSSSPISPPATIILAAAAQLTFIDTSAPDDFDPVSGTLLVTATNTNAPLTFGIAGGTADLSFSGYNQSLTVAYGTLYLSSTTGDYAFIPNDTTINALTAPTAANFTLMASDGTLSTQQTVAFALDGANDAPTLQPVTGPTYTDASAASASSAASLELAVTNTSEPGVFTAATGTLMAADVDLPAQTLTYGIDGGTADNSLSGYNVSLTGTYGKLFVNSGTGNYEFVPNETAIKALPATTAIENFTVTVSDGSLSAERIFTVTVNGVHDAPTLTVSDASGNEDTPIALSIASALTDTDGSETLSITIAGVPSGATLSHGTNNGGGNWTVTPAQLAGLTITPPANSDADFALTVTATSKETSSGNTASTVDTIHVTVDAVADAPTLTVSDASGNEDTPIALSIASALTDTDGSETLSITIAGLPSGATLSHGTNNGGGNWTVTPAQLAGLTITPPANSDADFALTVTATSKETSSGNTASTVDTIHVTVDAVADAPTLTVSDASGNEDTPIALSIASALTDTDASETLSITISGVPTGAMLSAGIDNGGGSWTVTPSQLAGLTITPPANSDADFILTVTATSKETNGGNTASTVGTIHVTVNAVVDAPTLTVSDAFGNEDTPIALSIASALTDIGGSETLSITISGVPTGAMLSAGIDNGGGSWTVTPDQLAGLTITPPANSDADFTLTVTATSKETGSGNTASTADTIHVTVDAVADAPTLTVSDVSGDENTPIALSIASALTDIDGSETLSITVAGVPSGAMLSHGIDNGDGSWTVTPDQLAGLTVTPPANSHTDFTLTVTATSKETVGNDTASTVDTINVAVNAVVVDQFPTRDYGAWVEEGDDGTATGGEFQIAYDPKTAPDDFQIRLSDDDNERADPDLLSRTIDLSGATSATLTFDYRRAIPDGEANDRFLVLASSDGVNFAQIGQQIGATGSGRFVDSTYQTFTFDLTPYISAQTTIRFSVGDDVDNGDVVYVDNVRFTYTTAATDPLILDLGVPGMAFSSLETGVSFDINGDGILDRIAWTAGDDGILAYDLDGSGSIDSGDEIFSSYFASGRHASGLVALATLDGNGDGVIDSADSGFGNLQVWQDLNHDGISETGELTSLMDLGITAINLHSAPAGTFVDGQQVLTQGTFNYADGTNGMFVEVALDTATGDGRITDNGDGALLPLSGVINNTGTIALDSTGHATTLELIQHGVTLQGGGQLVLSDSDANVIVSAAPGVTFTNADNTISGAGQLGDWQMTLVNNGTIVATGAHALIIDTGSNAVINTGTLEATGSGGLVVDSDIANTGLIWAHGGDITVNGSVSGAGGALLTGNATLEFAAAASINVTFVGADDFGTLVLDNPTAYTGQIFGFTGTGPENSDIINLKGITFDDGTSWTYYDDTGSNTGGTLTIYDTVNGVTTAVDSLTFGDGEYTTANFILTSDGNGGTLIADPPADFGTGAGTLATSNADPVHNQASDSFAFNSAFSENGTGGSETAQIVEQSDQTALQTVSDMFAHAADASPETSGPIGEGVATVSGVEHDKVQTDFLLHG